MLDEYKVYCAADRHQSARDIVEQLKEERPPLRSDSPRGGNPINLDGMWRGGGRGPAKVKSVVSHGTDPALQSPAGHPMSACQPGQRETDGRRGAQ